jgi:hypothetical protein
MLLIYFCRYEERCDATFGTFRTQKQKGRRKRLALGCGQGKDEGEVGGGEDGT